MFSLLTCLHVHIYILYAKKPTENKDRELERRGESESWIGDIKSTTERERALHWHMHTVCYSSFFSLYFFIFSSLYHWNGAQQGYKLNNLILWLWHFEPLASAISLDSIESYAYISQLAVRHIHAFKYVCINRVGPVFLSPSGTVSLPLIWCVYECVHVYKCVCVYVHYCCIH